MKNWATIINNEPWYPVVYGWFVTTTAKGILHELGHSLDLFPHDYTCTDHNIMDPGKNSVRDYLTTSQIAKMHRSLSLNNTRKFVECTNTNDTWNVTDNSLIDFDIKFFHDVKVNYGATLLITCNASFLKDSKIIVEPGGKLVLDGGLLTNGCEGEFWPGIEVWGDRTRRQIPTYQGWVVMQNGAVIENARFGITTCEKDENGWVVWKKTGGIIHASDCMFRNNYKAVEFLTYPFPQMSFFNNVSFLTSDTWLDPNGYSSDFVSLLDVYGIRFNGCTFANENTDTLFPAPVTSGRGIYSVDAGYTVDQLCLSNDNPCTTSIPSFFGGLYYAIKAENTIPVNTVSIKNSRFVDNCKDVYLSGINFANITRNSFFLPRNNPNSNLYGLYLNNCTGYTVQENSFASQTQNIFASYYGIVVQNSGTDPNEIYNNRFQSLYVAIDAQECNRQNGGLTGLVLKCNDYDNTGYDQVSTTGENPPQDSQKDYLGIALYQGDSLSVTGPAGNTFSVQHSGGESDLYNDVNRFKYYHHFQSVTGTPRVQPDYYINVAVRPTTFEYNKNVCCPSKLGLGGNSNQSIEVMETEINLTNEKQNQLNSLVDGGNTEQTVTDIIFSDPPDALQLRQDLLDNSPYLSDTAMQEAIEKESVLPNEMIRDILVANPHSATSDKVLDMLDERFVPMPDSMMSEILANENIVSAKEDLETEISSHKQAGFQSFYDLVRYYKNDTVSQGSNDSLISLLSSWNYLTAKYQLAMEYLAANDFNSMNNVLASIPGNFILDETEMAKYDAYLSYLNLLKELRSEEKSIFEIDSTQIGLLQEMAEQSSEPVSTYVKNILIANGIIQYDEQVIAPLELKSAKDAKYRKTSSFVQIRYLKLFPNPATRYIIAEYNLKDKASKTGIVTLKISSMYGREIESRQLKKELDQVLIITKDLQEGAYICSLVSEGTVLDQEVFTISH